MRRAWPYAGPAGIAIILVLSLWQPTSGAGFGATCLNRHDATAYSVLIHGAVTNYTGYGDTQVVGSPWGYDVTLFFHLNQSIMMNAQLDTTNGSVFISTNAWGTAFRECLYNIGPDATGLVVQAHLANMTGQQTVVWSTGTWSGSYDVTWLGP